MTMQRRLLSKAFDILKVVEHGKWYITWETWQGLMHAIDKKMPYTKINLLFFVIDDDGNDKIGKFHNCCTS